jgi:hypothetical protein
MSLPYNILSDILYQTGTGATHIRNFTLNQSYQIGPYVRPDPRNNYTLNMTARVTTETITLPDLTTETVQLPSPSWILTQCDYVDDGFFIQTSDTLRYFTSDTSISTRYINSLPEKYTEQYNYAIWIITGAPSSRWDPDIPRDTTVTPTFDWNQAQPIENTDLGRQVGLMVFDTFVGSLTQVTAASTATGQTPSQMLGL